MVTGCPDAICAILSGQDVEIIAVALSRRNWHLRGVTVIFRPGLSNIEHEFAGGAYCLKVALLQTDSDDAGGCRLVDAHRSAGQQTTSANGVEPG